MSAIDDELVEVVAEAIADVDGEILAAEFWELYRDQARAVLSVPALRDALARDAQVAERVEEWPGLGWLRGKALGMAQDPYVKGKPHFHSELMALINSAAEIAALYPSPGDRDEEQQQ